VSDRWKEINEPEDQITPFDAQQFCTQLTETEGLYNPIDDFYDYAATIITLGKPEFLIQNPILGRLLLLALVSGVELYFRSILAGMIRVCPLIHNRASELPISLYALEYYGLNDIGLGFLEGISLADSSTIIKQTERLTDIKIKKHSSVETAIADFGKICQFRHASAHSRGQLSARNLRELALSTDENKIMLMLNFDEFQNCALICHNCVKAYNRYMYEKIVERWIAKHILTGHWAEDSEKFAALFTLFKSRKDNLGFNTAEDTYADLKPSIIDAITRNIS